MSRKKPKRSKTSKNLYEPVYRQQVVILWGYSLEEFRDYCRKRKIKGVIPDGFSGMCTEIYDNSKSVHFWVVWVSNCDDYYSLTHECMHLAAGILRACNIKIDRNYRNYEEAHIMYTEYWIKRIWRLVNK